MSAAPKPPKLRIDRGSTVPAYRQLADELRYRIATGDLTIGARLPTVAEGATLWGVNLHTVRHAYGQLAAEGMIDMQRGRGTTVIARVPVGATAPGGVSAFVDWVTARAAQDFGLAPADLADLITANRGAPTRARALCVAECSEHQASHLAAQLETRWGIETTGWSLDWADEPPPGPFVATLFHYNDIRQRWPHRMKDAMFISIRPARALEETLKRFGRRRGPLRICLVERDESMARSMAADVSVLLPSARYSLTPLVVKGPPGKMTLPDDALYLFSPRLWADVPADLRDQANTAEVEYDIPTEEHARLAHHFGWRDTANEVS